MRYLLCCLALVACTSDPVADTTTPDMCSNFVQEETVAVPFQFDVGTETDTYTMDNGCLFVSITHYVYDPDAIGGPGGSAPDPLHCDVDGCGGPNDRQLTYTDPAMSNTNMMNMGH